MPCKKMFFPWLATRLIIKILGWIWHHFLFLFLETLRNQLLLWTRSLNFKSQRYFCIYWAQQLFFKWPVFHVNPQVGIGSELIMMNWFQILRLGHSTWIKSVCCGVSARRDLVFACVGSSFWMAGVHWEFACFYEWPCSIGRSCVTQAQRSNTL